MSRRRGLSQEDHRLWSQVARSATPLVPRRALDDAFPAPAPKSVSRPARPEGADPGQMVFDPFPFRVGQTATAARPGPVLGPAGNPAERLAGGPLRMDPKTHRRMLQGKLRPEARLDLHGLTLTAAHPELIHFILSSKARGLRLVLVITGKGRGTHGPLPTRPGALRHQVPIWLHQPPLGGVVQQTTAAHYRHGGEGAYYVYLRR